MNTEVSFADLTHTGTTVDANYFPLGSAFIAAYAIENLDNIDVKIFKYPKDFASYLDETIPKVVCFSNYQWNLKLHYHYATRIKQKAPGTITIFGGPNYPVDLAEQEQFLRKYSAIDFYINEEGEIAFTELFKIITESKFDLAIIKSKAQKAPNCHYLFKEKVVHGEPLPRIDDVNIIPSPYLSGLMDKFFDPYLNPMIQTQRGCPYSCTFCYDGNESMNKLRRFSQSRINAEIEYISERRACSGLSIADDNFGIFKEDLDTAQLLAEMKEQYNWPKFIMAAPAKNNKDRVKEIAKILKDGFLVGAAVQHTDPEVLKNIKRSNISTEKIVALTQRTDDRKTTSFSEVILNLPGDTKDKHFKAVLELIDAGIEEIRMYQFIVLPGTPASKVETRETYGYQTRFRVLPRCFGRYTGFGEEFWAYEYHEVCVASKTMPFEDYLECRKFNLLIEVFNNGGMFQELLFLLQRMKILPSTLFKRLWETSHNNPVFQNLYEVFSSDEKKNFWEKREDLESFLDQPGVADRYLSGEYGKNQIMRCRSLALIEHMEAIAKHAFKNAKQLLIENKKMNEQLDVYLQELEDFIVCKKGELLTLNQPVAKMFHFDFIKMAEKGFNVDPFDHKVDSGISLNFYHSKKTAGDIETYFKQFGYSVDGMGHFLQRQGSMNLLYKQVAYS
ncbi:MAG: hypothetical protein CMH70_05670 [Nitrosomonadaceae bacterium]|nr:hypothetical protein [Nitrosomonadaceae bacterium]